MAFWLKSEERRVAARGQRVRTDLFALQQARVRFASGLRRELGRPKALLACFAAGLGFGWLRGARTRRELDGEAVDGAQSGRLAQVAAAVLAGARLYEQLRRAAALVEQQEPASPPPPAAANAAGEGSAAFPEGAPDEAQGREADPRYGK